MCRIYLQGAGVEIDLLKSILKTDETTFYPRALHAAHERLMLREEDLKPVTKILERHKLFFSSKCFQHGFSYFSFVI